MVCYGSVVNFFTLGLCPPTQDMGGRKEFIMKAKARSRILSWVLTLALALSLVPTALAANHQISINKDKLSLNVGETADLIVTGEWTTNGAPLDSPYYIQWSSSDNNVVRVSGKGSAYFTNGSHYAEVTGLKSGSATITGELKAGQGDSGTIDAIHKVTCQVTVTSSAEVSISFTNSLSNIPAGESRNLSATVTGGSASKYNFEWSSTGPAVYNQTHGDSWSREKTSQARFDFPSSGSGNITVKATPVGGGETITDTISYSVANGAKPTVTISGSTTGSVGTSKGVALTARLSNQSSTATYRYEWRHVPQNSYESSNRVCYIEGSGASAVAYGVVAGTYTFEVQVFNDAVSKTEPVATAQHSITFKSTSSGMLSVEPENVNIPRVSSYGEGVYAVISSLSGMRDPVLTWTSSNPSAVLLSTGGLSNPAASVETRPTSFGTGYVVTPYARAKGEATVTVVLSDGFAKLGEASFTVTVGSILPSKIPTLTLDKSNFDIKVGETQKMSITLNGAEFGTSTSGWDVKVFVGMTSDPRYVDFERIDTVSRTKKELTFTGLKNGTADYYIRLTYNGQTIDTNEQKFVIKVGAGSVDGISLNRTNLTVPANLTSPGSLTATLGRNITSGSGYTVRWYSGNADVVRVGNSTNTSYYSSTFNASSTMSSVNIYGITNGRSAYVYASLIDNAGKQVGETQSCLVTVGQNGNVTLSPSAGTPPTSSIVYLNNYSSSAGGYYATFGVVPYVGNTVANTSNGYYVTYSWTLNGSSLNSSSSSYTLYAYGLSSSSNHRLRCTANVYRGTTSAAVSSTNLVGSNYLEWTVSNSAYSQINVSATVYDSGSYALGDVDLESNRSVVEKIAAQIASGYYLYSVSFTNNTDTRGTLSASRGTDYYASSGSNGRNYLNNVTFSPSASSGTAVFNFTALAYPNNNYGGSSNARTYSGTLTFYIREGSANSSITYSESAGNHVSLNARDFQNWWTGMYSRGSLNYVTFTSVSGGGTLYHNYTNSSSTNVVSRGTSCYANPSSSQVGINNLTFVPSNSSANTVNIRFTANGTTGSSSGTYTRTGTLTILYIKGDVKLEYSTGSDGTVSLKSSDFTEAYRNAVGSTSSNLTFRFKNVPTNGTLTYKSGSSTITLTNSNINNQTFTPSTIGNVTYTARNNTASNLTDTVEFTCYNAGTARFVGTITFNAKPTVVQNLVVRFDCTSTNGVELDPIKFWNSAAAVMNSRYITFGVPSGGSLYLNGAALSANTKLSFLNNAGYQVFSGVSYRPAAGAANGTVTVPFQAYDGNGSLVASGNVQIVLNLSTTPSTPKPVVPNVNLTDVPANSWYAQYVNPLVNAGIIGGFDDKTFRPNEDVTYGQALALIMRAVGINVQQGTGSTWAMPYLVEAASRGLLPNVPYGLNDSIDRNAIAYITAKAMNLTPVADTSNSPFPDSKDPYVLALYNAGIIAGSDKGFEGTKSLSRAEVSAIIWRIYDKQGNNQGTQNNNQSTGSGSSSDPDRDAPFGY